MKRIYPDNCDSSRLVNIHKNNFNDTGFDLVYIKTFWYYTWVIDWYNFYNPLTNKVQFENSFSIMKSGDSYYLIK